MKFHATLGDYKTDLEIRLHGSRAFAVIEGRHYEVNVHEFSADRFLLMNAGRIFDCRVEGRPESGKPINVVVGTTSYSITLIDPKRLRSALAADAHSDQAAQIIAAMPGKVVRLLVELGAEVNAGDGIITVEAMKMQNEMKSPKAGTVVALNVEVGGTVNAGDVLAVIE